MIENLEQIAVTERATLALKELECLRLIFPIYSETDYRKASQAAGDNGYPSCSMRELAHHIAALRTQEIQEIFAVTFAFEDSFALICT